MGIGNKNKMLQSVGPRQV